MTESRPPPTGPRPLSIYAINSHVKTEKSVVNKALYYVNGFAGLLVRYHVFDKIRILQFHIL